jgi:hypothetical protein
VNAKPRATVRKKLVTTNPQAQRKAIQDSTPKFSHTEYLPLSLHVGAGGVLCKKIKVKTTEQIWYRDAVFEVIVPPGTETDLASIPRALWTILSPWDIALPAIFHDVLYSQQPVARVVADAALLSMLEQRQVQWYVRWPVYAAVRMFGRSAWNHHARAIARRRRVLEYVKRNEE